MKHILVISPHFDDAVFSCADHIIQWITQNNTVNVVNVFTSFRTPAPSKDALALLHFQGYSSPSEYERARRDEDRKAMHMLGITSNNLDLVDGLFRATNGKPLYTRSQLFQGQVSLYDRTTITNTKELLSIYRSYDCIIVPLGIGKHIDHEIVYQSCKNVFAQDKLLFYADLPYGKYLRNWTIKKWLKCVFSKKTTLKPTERKSRIIRLYGTQRELFDKVISQPETILGAI